MATVSDVATPIASYHHRDFPLADLRAMKKDQLISVCIPAHDEQATVGAIVETLRRELVDAAGARIVSVPKIDGSAVPTGGKGEAMRRGLGASSGDIVVFLDGDVENFGTHFVTGLLGPILAFPQTVLVKACYRRPFGESPAGGGRVTELVARPIVSLLFPELSGVTQPLAGEVAVRREVLERLELADGYGVELGMLIDVSRLYGVESIAQVDLEVRAHRNRPLHELAPQARDVLDIALRRAGVRVA
ncbi:MAG: glucosyl-3-phosphoglycerate synthase [Acidimicrobiales bacterium]|jgi:glucosyl-3-phosphoglycerate synthase